jgi:hypothetical protein
MLQERDNPGDLSADGKNNDNINLMKKDDFICGWDLLNFRMP